ncbi:rhodanese-like domain-containing protein [Paenibacillus abyssi]|uniref:Rhodanese domain-containing protein n=1 Tax=Paenibacillus abyssi TaxID=1340531 RepID=A0A917G4T6_9BACL|nr:rhodanese-like domain-containing protein [Paenibacillus abyssi]GGG23040.1 hypothetical protein GCM10010916_44560 [Paenibacillus abyssi]
MDTSTIINIVLVALAALFLYSRLAPVKGLKNLPSQDFNSALQGTKEGMLIDVREPGEFKGGFIPGARNIPLSQLARRLDEIPKDKELYLYCRSGMRSKTAAKLLAKNGYRKLAHLQGGIGAWSGKVSR